MYFGSCPTLPWGFHIPKLPLILDLALWALCSFKRNHQFCEQPCLHQRLNRLLQVFKCQDASPTSELRLSPEIHLLSACPKGRHNVPRFRQKKRANRNRMLHHLLKTMLLNNWVVQNAMLWRDQHMKTSSEPQSQVSLAASGGSKGLLQDSWSSKKRLPICLLTKKIWGLLSRCSFQKKKKVNVSHLYSPQILEIW